MAAGMSEMMTTCARGQVDYAFLGGAQIDKYGNINSTMVGSDYSHPKVRFPGSGGANDFASLCWRTMIMTVHSKDRFVEKCDFITSPGFLSGGNARDVAGLPEGGPYMIITDLAVMTFHPDSKAMMLQSLNPGVEVEQVKENTGFELIIPDTIGRTEAPTAEELRILREEVDPLKVVIGR
jgi:glutaconate CoA-transferase, subunit B